MENTKVGQVLVNSLLDVFCKLGDMPRLEVGSSCYALMDTTSFSRNPTTTK